MEFPGGLVIEESDIVVAVAQVPSLTWELLYARDAAKMIQNFAFFFSFFLKTAPVAYGSSQARGSNRSYSCRPTPQPQQHWIQAESKTYTTAYGNAGSLTHWVRPWMEPISSRTLCRILNLLSHSGSSFAQVLKVVNSVPPHEWYTGAQAVNWWVQ